MVIEDTGQLRGPKKTGSPKTTGLSSIIHRGVNNKGPEIALRMNELFVHQLHFKRVNSDNSKPK